MDPVVQENWFDAYDVLREESPAYFMPQIGMYVLTRYEDIEYVLRQPSLFTLGSDVQNTEPLITHAEAQALYKEQGWPRYTPLSENLPQHAHYRALVDPVLTASAIRRQEGFVRATINELIDGWIDQGEIEFIQAFAEPLPMIVIAELLGFPRMDLPQLKQWSAAWVLPFSRGLNLKQEMQAVREHIELQHYIFAAMQEKRRQPKDDIISHLVRIEVEDADQGRRRPLTDTEIIGLTDHLLIGGNETTTFALSNALMLLFQHPQLSDQLRTDPNHIKPFVEEALRIESPTQGLYRFVAEDSEIGGVKVPKGTTLSIRFGAGNRDPRRYPCPAQLDLERRNPGRHLAFGMGEKICPGATLSRLEQAWAWEILLKRLKKVGPAVEKNDYRHRPGIWLRALEAIHMRFEPA